MVVVTNTYTGPDAERVNAAIADWATQHPTSYFVGVVLNADRSVRIDHAPAGNPGRYTAGTLRYRGLVAQHRISAAAVDALLTRPPVACHPPRPDNTDLPATPERTPR